MEVTVNIPKNLNRRQRKLLEELETNNTCIQNTECSCKNIECITGNSDNKGSNHLYCLKYL